MRPEIKPSTSTSRDVDSKRYGGRNNLRNKASIKSALISLGDIPYRPFPRNSSLETAKELKEIRQAQKMARHGTLESMPKGWIKIF